MSNKNDDYIFTYNDTNRHGLGCGITSVLFLITACALLFARDITYLLTSLVPAFIGACTGSYGIWQSAFNSKNRFPKKLCKAATVLNILFLALVLGIIIYMIAVLSIMGCK
jgi:carbon starvation protein CstA